MGNTGTSQQRHHFGTTGCVCGEDAGRSVPAHCTEIAVESVKVSHEETQETEIGAAALRMHLKELYKQSTAGLTPDRSQQVLNLLNRSCQGFFILTSMVDHSSLGQTMQHYAGCFPFVSLKDRLLDGWNVSSSMTFKLSIGLAASMAMQMLSLGDLVTLFVSTVTKRRQGEEPERC